MRLSWSARRQLLYLLAILFVFAIGAIFVYLKIAAPTCFDGKQNQKEQGIDCGGQCKRECLGVIKEPVILWVKPLKVVGGVYDVVAVAENRNLFLSAQSVKYQFKLYDERNILIASKEGETFINPGRKFAVFDHGIIAGSRVPARAFLEFQKDIEWEIYKGENLGIVVSKKEYSDLPRPSLSVTVENKTLADVKELVATAIIYGNDDNAIAASAMKIGEIKGGSSAEVFFTWPEKFDQKYARDEIFLSAKSVSSI